MRYATAVGDHVHTARPDGTVRCHRAERPCILLPAGTDPPDPVPFSAALVRHTLDQMRARAGGPPTTPRCTRCDDTGHVCEDHDTRPWEGTVGPAPGHDEHGGAGIPCPDCCDPVPTDGSRSATDAFTPRTTAPS